MIKKNSSQITKRNAILREKTYFCGKEEASKPFAISIDLLLELLENFLVADGRAGSRDVLLAYDIDGGMELWLLALLELLLFRKRRESEERLRSV